MAQNITIDQFKSYLQNGDPKILKGNSDLGYTINAGLEFYDLDINASLFENFHFQQGITFTNCIFNQFTVFKKTKSTKTILFNNCKTDLPSTENPGPGMLIEDPELSDLVLENCTFDNGLKIKASENAKKTTVQSKIKTLQISSSKINGSGLSLSDILIQKRLILKGVNSDSEIELKNLKVNLGISISSSQSKGISFSDKLETAKSLIICETRSDFLTLSEIKIETALTIENSEILGDISIKNTSVRNKSEISIKKGPDYSLENKFHQSTPSPSIDIESSDFNEGFTFDGGGHIAKKLNLIFSASQKGRLIFSNTNFEQLNLTGINSECNVFFRNIGLSSVIIQDFLNLKSLSFSNLNSTYTKSKNAIFKVLDSDLGNWELANFDFDSFKKIIWRDSQVTGLRTSAVSWFKDNKLEAEGEIEPSTCFRRREFYRQLKQASEKQGDRINELEFKRREIKAYRKGLKIRNENRWDRFTIWTGGSNNHGQSWVKPLVIITAFSTFLFPFLFIFADKEISIIPSWTNYGWDRFWSKVSEHGTVWIQLFNPARRVNDLFSKPLENPFWVYFLDGFHRIVLAFFIFQIVSAFRKFVK